MQEHGSGFHSQPYSNRRNALAPSPSGLTTAGCPILFTFFVTRVECHETPQASPPISHLPASPIEQQSPRSLLQPRKVARLVNVHFPTGERNGDHRARRLGKQGARPFVSPERKQIAEHGARKHRRNAQNACVG